MSSADSLGIVNHRQSPLKLRKNAAVKNRIAHWDPYELAAKIKAQVNLDKLVRDKIVRLGNIEQFDLEINM